MLAVGDMVVAVVWLLIINRALSSETMVYIIVKCQFFLFEYHTLSGICFCVGCLESGTRCVSQKIDETKSSGASF